MRKIFILFLMFGSLLGFTESTLSVTEAQAQRGPNCPSFTSFNRTELPDSVECVHAWDGSTYTFNIDSNWISVSHDGTETGDQVVNAGSFSVYLPYPAPSLNLNVAVVGNSVTLSGSYDNLNPGVWYDSCWGDGQCFGVQGPTGSFSETANVGVGSYTATFNGLTASYTVDGTSASTANASQNGGGRAAPQHGGCNGLLIMSVVVECVASVDILLIVTPINLETGNWMPENQVVVTPQQFNEALAIAHETGENQLIVELTDFAGKPVYVHALATPGTAEIQVTSFNNSYDAVPFIWNITPGGIETPDENGNIPQSEESDEEICPIYNWEQGCLAF